MEKLTVKEPLQMLGTRLVKRKDYYERPRISSPEDAAHFLRDRMEEGLDREVFGVICLSPAGQVNHCEILSVGDINTTLADPRAVFRAAILSASAGVIIFHTHPTTPLTGPSEQDVTATKKMIQAGDLMGICVLDHIVFNDDKWWSFSIAAKGQEIINWCEDFEK